MEYANEECFRVKNNTHLKRLEFTNRKWTRKIIKSVKRHKLISISIIAFIIFSLINIFMIYNFMQILVYKY